MDSAFNYGFVEGMETFSRKPIAMKAEGLILCGYLGKNISMGAEIIITYIYIFFNYLHLNNF